MGLLTKVFNSFSILLPYAGAALLSVFLGMLIGQAQAETMQQDQRIISIGSSLTEIVYALNAQDKLVAVDTTSLYPEEATQLPNVGYMRALSAEGVLASNPDHILMMEGAGPTTAVDVLKAASIKLTEVSEAYSPQGILRKIEVVGNALHLPAQTQALKAKVKADLDEAIAYAQEQSNPLKVVFVISEGGGKPLVAGRETGAHAVIELAGATNVFANLRGYKPISKEALIAAAPEVVMMMSRSGSSRQSDILKQPGFSLTPAGLNGNLIVMAGAYLLGFGPRTAQAIRDLSDHFAEIATKTPPKS
ncbi:hemin ABC transporter substrate-binding protein [Pseudovibrio japonicus]|uniref:Hemin ABC transporter substrate-binding protein n=1 Tax=Pseudovibrio japonicus TaxID=366534 RepID=A0ABQ3E694_9HYPH|nr:ABC transporter substrate-binding protein [Pseudovibrio japonicus]GHB26406.1 hemin ABC transporter substrate-binding protein [Pseudovibrio japonicus]